MAFAKDGWNSINGKMYYVKGGQPYKGWHKMDAAEGEKTSHWSFFDKTTGALYTGWHYMTSKEGEKTPHYSYFGPNGWLRTGWQNMGTAENPDGNNRKHMSYFGSNGWLRTGWQTMGTEVNPDGGKAKHISYFGSNGWLRTGWIKLGKGTNEPDGNSTPHWSYFGSNGWLRTGLVYMSPTDDGGNPGHYSYFDSKGWLATNKNITVGNKTYKADDRGWLTLIGPTYSSFVNKYKGKATDYDGAYGAQCVDEIKQYLHDLWGINPGAWGNAHMYYDNFNAHKELTDNFIRIANTPSFVPKKGDIIVWKKALNGAYGHIAICTGEGDTNYFYSWDQNWTGRNDAMTQIRHNYDYVAGVLRPKDQSLMV